MKEKCKKLEEKFRKLFGYGIAFCLFAGGMTFFGYLFAIIVGGEAAAAICAAIYKVVIPFVVRFSTVFVLLGLIIMYLAGEVALTAEKK